MIKKCIQISSFIMLLFIACKKETTNHTEATVQIDSTKAPQEESFRYVENQDTIVLTLHQNEGSISGELSFLPYEKDARKGAISDGVMKGDTLFASYKSMQEGQETMCEIAFLKKGQSYLLTNDIFGEINYEYNSDFTEGHFKDKSKIKFDGETLQKVEK